jgi:hypothetical protein
MPSLTLCELISAWGSGRNLATLFNGESRVATDARQLRPRGLRFEFKGGLERFLRHRKPHNTDPEQPGAAEFGDVCPTGSAAAMGGRKRHSRIYFTRNGLTSSSHLL